MDRSRYTIAAGDAIVPLTTYQLRQGPRVWLDGPINKGAWSRGTSYRSHEMVSDGGKSYMAIADNANQQPPNADFWVEVDPARVGPGTFSASLRNTTGKASNGNLAFSQLKAMLAKTGRSRRRLTITLTRYTPADLAASCPPSAGLRMATPHRTRRRSVWRHKRRIYQTARWRAIPWGPSAAACRAISISRGMTQRSTFRRWR